MNKGLLLLSGGIDSPVAGYLMKRKGTELLAIHFSLEPFTDNAPEKKTRILAKKIGCKKLFVIKHGNQHAEIVDKCTHRFYYVLTRRLMFRIAEKIAETERCDFLITGENLGQVGSQTLENMHVIDQAIGMEVARPILCNDKNETIALAREIGTYDISKGPEVCSMLGPKHPATRSTLEKIEMLEKNLDIQKMVEEAVKNRIEIEL